MSGRASFANQLRCDVCIVFLLALLANPVAFLRESLLLDAWAPLKLLRTQVLQVEDVYPRGAAKPEYRLLLEHFK